MPQPARRYKASFATAARIVRATRRAAIPPAHVRLHANVAIALAACASTVAPSPTIGNHAEPAPRPRPLDRGRA